MNFWPCMFIAFCALAILRHWIVTLLRLRDARVEIQRLSAEVTRCRAWLGWRANNWEVGAGHVRYQ